MAEGVGATGFTNLPDWIQRTLSNGFTGEPSTKRHIVAIASITLCLVTFILGMACAYRVARFGDVGMGTVYALNGMAVFTAALAGAAYRKPEKDPEPSAPSLPLVVVQGSGSSVGPATPPGPGTGVPEASSAGGGT